MQQHITGKIGEYLPKLEKHMKIKPTILLVPIILVAVACGRAEQLPTIGAAESPSPTPAKILPTEPLQAGEDGTSQVFVDGPVSECTLVSSLPEPAQEYAGIFAVTENDWAVGPKDAAVTFIEYGDFQ